MNFSFEAPINYIDDFTDLQDYLFILAPHLDNEKYFNYCKNFKGMKILDNGCYELGSSISPKRLIELANKIDASVVVIPDVLFNKEASRKVEKEFLELLTPETHRFKLMKVVCSNTLKGYLESLKEVAEDDICDIIGLSQSRNILTPNLSFCMTWLGNNSELNNVLKKPIHLLGATSPYEITESSQWNQIKSVDTGRPINFAFHGIRLPELNRSDEYKKLSGKDIDTEDYLNIDLARDNIKEFKKYYGPAN